MTTHSDSMPIENTSNNEHFQDVLARGLADPSRRALLRRGVGLSAATVLPAVSGCASSDEGGLKMLAEPLSAAQLKFTPVTKSVLDTVVVPTGYTARVIHATGDRLFSTETAYGNSGLEADDWSRRIGDHHDGMEMFYLDANGKVTTTATARAVLAVNHESSADAHFFHPNGQTSGAKTGQKFSQFGAWDDGVRPALEVDKEINHHGVSVVELNITNGAITGYKLDAPLNRRVTPNTVVDVRGPAAHLDGIRQLFATKFDPKGTTARGTLNNCGSGRTPWGTMLTCEENWAVYFNMPAGATVPTDTKLMASRTRYGVATTAPAGAAGRRTGQGWYTPADTGDMRFERWNIAAGGAAAANDFRNEPHTFGYNLEIDPADATSRPAKRVAMGRFAHEASVYSIPRAGQPLAFYMGCDSRNEYIYKFVTAASWSASDAGGGMAAGNKYLDEGKLYAAKFNADGTGQWLELSYDAPAIRTYSAFAFANQAEVYVHTRIAADAVGATKMDRPEWGAVNPAYGEVYFCLTNNNSTNRKPGTTDAANPRAYADPDGVKGSGNPNGHIIRFRETGDLATATTFKWDIFLFGAEEDMDSTNVNVSNLSANNALSSPDGLWFSQATGILWIETDDGAFTDETNCMLLAAVPGAVGDGAKVTITNSLSGSTATQETFVGGLLGEARLKRFLVGPKGAEITGVAESADGKALFVNIQHPGENTAALGSNPTFSFESQWPGTGTTSTATTYGPAGRPRSATIVITRTDGGVVGR
ncbi:MAG: PhoX family protein [Betaproteobacteria bacterium]